MSTAMAPLFCESTSNPTPIFWLGIISPVLITAFHLFLYGVYVVLFQIGIVVLKRRPDTPDRLFHQITLAILFCLTSLSVPINLVHDTANVALWLWPYDVIMKVKHLVIILGIIRYVILLLMGLTVDAILIFRFFAISRYQKRFMVIPIVIFISIDAGAMTSGTWAKVSSLFKQPVSPADPRSSYLDILTMIFLGCNIILTLLLTLAMARQIWLAKRQNRILFPNTSGKRFTTIISILLESCALYIISLIIYAVAIPFYVDLGSIMIQIGGLAPTLLIVRANIPQNQDRNIETKPRHLHPNQRATAHPASSTHPIVLNVVRDTSGV
ncbi:hypothetical protein E1B28_005354 [Marasmius oreades]|uniref:Uncharacterized protein n=1 Tax=Marasmius oreades TaxID=181124 RepID=A0A9P7S308_9AGAR|nr:uncharacterized protein E1B28_005354 [Marasmius oreades]KAG7094526.1 hypothetical protein E1B28_005354 [Marasmius oreades]